MEWQRAQPRQKALCTVNTARTTHPCSHHSPMLAPLTHCPPINCSEGVRTVKLLGSMSINERRAVLHAFKTHPQVQRAVGEPLESRKRAVRKPSQSRKSQCQCQCQCQRHSRRRRRQQLGQHGRAVLS